LQLVEQDLETLEREPTIIKDTQVGKEFYRQAIWQDEGTTVGVEAIAFVTGVLAQRNEDGSIDLLDTTGPTLPLKKDQYIQPVERVIFLWTRQRITEDGTPAVERELDFCNEVGLFYSPTVEEAEKQCRIFMENLDFEKHCNPEAWD
jgi:hypothetical protein